MRTFISIPRTITDDDDYPVDTPEEIEAAQAAMRTAGITMANIYAGEPDGLGDCVQTGNVLTAGRDYGYRSRSFNF